MKQVVRKRLTVVGVIIVFGLLASGEAESQSMPAAQTPQEHAPMQQQLTSGKRTPIKQRTKTFIEAIQHHGTSGTSAEPNSTPIPMLLTLKGEWRLMFHGEAFLNALQQSGPRGADKVFSTNWFIPSGREHSRPESC